MPIAKDGPMKMALRRGHKKGIELTELTELILINKKAVLNV
tara:strand:+ start:2782 stop:2904 length:123 start_codon:yes stop_codon:yes gene_type:complete